MNFVNLTPHPIVLNDGTVFQPSGIKCRAEQSISDFVGLIAVSSVGKVELPEEQEDTIFIAPMVVAQVASAMGRRDVVAPATNHSETRRDEKGLIQSVPGFILFI